MLPAESDCLHEILGTLPNATVIEAGAYDGETTLFIYNSLATPPRSYTVFEPDPRNFKQTQAFYAAVLQLKDVALFPCALGAANGEAPMYLSHDKRNVHGSSSLRDPANHKLHVPEIFHDLEPSEKVKVLTYDMVVSGLALKGIKTVDFLFTDIEGSERDLIEHGREGLARTRYWYTEFWTVTPPPYAGMWLKDELLANLPGWEVVKCFENDMLLRNTTLAP